MPQSKESKSNYIINDNTNHEQTQINQYSSIKIKNLKSAKQVLDNMHESESDDESSEISSFLLDKDEFRNQSLMNDPRTNSTYLISSQIDCVNNSHCNLNFLGPEAQIKLAQLFEEAGLKHLSPDDGKGADPEILRQLTSSVNCALEEAVAALTLTRIKSGTSKGVQTPDDQANLDALHQRALESLEEGESLLSLACSSGYYELVQVLLAMNTSIEERGIKGDTTPLMEAASGGYYEIVKLLLEHGADPKAQSLSGNTALTYSCIGGHTEVARLLLKYGAEVEHQNENGHTALMEAATGGHVETARILVTEGRASINAHSNEFKESALTLACYKGNLEMVRFLLEAGADHEHKTEEMHTALMEASMDGHLEVAKLLLDHGAQVNMPPDSFESPLTLAACGGHVELANLLIERGANLEEINDEGYTPLMEAAREGHKDVVSLLLSHGSNVNAQTEETQETALTLACYGGFLQVADLLIKTGADIELGCNTPLMEASQEGHLDLVHYLLLAGANPHAQTGPGNTPLTFAAENGHTDIVVLLLHYGAEIDHESEGGKTPLIKAARNGHAAVVKLLVENGANPNKTTTNNEHTALSLAAYAGHIIIVELLLEYGADPTHKLKDNSTALIEASKNGHTDIVQLLLDFPKFLKQINSESASAATPSLLLEKQTLKMQQQQQLQHLQHLKQLQTHQQLQQQQLLLLKEKKQFAAQQLEHLQQQQKQLLTQQQHQQQAAIAPSVDSLKEVTTLQLASPSSPTDNNADDISNTEGGKGAGGNETSVIVMTTDAAWQADSGTQIDGGDKSDDAAALLKLAGDASLYQSFEQFQNQVASNAVSSSMHVPLPTALALQHNHPQQPQQQLISTSTALGPSDGVARTRGTYTDGGNYNLQSLAATKGMALRIGDKIRHLKDLLRNNYDLASLLGDVNEGAADAFHREMHTTDKWAHSINAAVRKIERYIATAQQRQLSLPQQKPLSPPNTVSTGTEAQPEGGLGERIVEGGREEEAPQQQQQVECEETEEEEEEDEQEENNDERNGVERATECDGADEDVLVSFTPEQLDSRLRMQQAQFDRLRRLQLQQQAAAQQRYLLLAASAAAASAAAAQQEATGTAVSRYDFNALRALAGAPGFLKTSEVEIEKIPNQQQVGAEVPSDQTDKGELPPDFKAVDRTKDGPVETSATDAGALGEKQVPPPIQLAAPPPPLCICDGKLVTLLPPSHHLDVACSVHAKSEHDKVEGGSGGDISSPPQRCTQPNSASPVSNKVTAALAQRPPQYYLPPYSLPFDVGTPDLCRPASVYDVTTSSEIVKLKNINASLTSTSSTFLPTLPMLGQLGPKGSDPYSTSSYSISLINNQYDIDIGKFGLDNLLDITEIEDLSNGIDMSQSAQFLDQHSQQPGGIEAACCQLLHLNNPDVAAQIFNRATGPSYYPGGPPLSLDNPVSEAITTISLEDESAASKSLAHRKSPTSTSLCYHAAAAAAHHHHHPFLNLAAAADLQRQQQQQAQAQFQHAAQLQQQYFASGRVAPPPPPLFSHHLHHHLHHLPPYATNPAAAAAVGQAATLNFNNVFTALQQPHHAATPGGLNAAAAAATANKKSMASAAPLAFEKCCNYQAASSLVQKLYDRAAPPGLEACQTTAQELPQASIGPEAGVVEESACKQAQAPAAAPACTPTSAGTGKKYYPAIEVDAQTDSNHDTALTLACAGGPPELVELLIKRGSSIEHRDKKGFTPLIIAATSGQANIVQLLLNHGVNIEAQSDRTKDTALSLACSSGRYEVVEVLLNNGAYIEHRNVSDYTPLSLAASGGHCNIIKLLLNHGAEINSRTGSKLGISPLMLAAMNGHLAAVKLLLDMGSDINAQIETNKNTALTLACFQGKHEVVSLFLEYKANIEHRAKTGLTPLMEAASGGFVDVGRVLIEKGADVNAAPVPSSRDTALTIAADKGHYKFVELLVQNGAQIEVKNKKGNSPLWLAANGGHLDVIQYLAQKGADIDSQDNRKVSCLMAAFKKGHIRTVRWMVKHVSQFPSDTECKRFNNTLVDKDMLKRCHQCMEIIIWAKDRQAAEANKNALDLLDELDKEKTREENKKAAAARRREKKRQKKKDKQIANPESGPHPSGHEIEALDEGQLVVEEKASTSSNSSTAGAGDKASSSAALRESAIQDAIARMDAVSLDDRVSGQEESGSTRKMSVLESWFVRKFNLKAPMLSSKSKTRPPDEMTNRETLPASNDDKKETGSTGRQSEKRLSLKKHSSSRHQQGKVEQTGSTVTQTPSSLLALNNKKASITTATNNDPDSSTNHHPAAAPPQETLSKPNSRPDDYDEDPYNPNDGEESDGGAEEVERDYGYHTTTNAPSSHNRYTGLVALTSTSDTEQRWSSTSRYSKHHGGRGRLRQDDWSDIESGTTTSANNYKTSSKPSLVSSKRTSLTTTTTVSSSSEFKTIMLKKKKSTARSHYRDRSSDHPNSTNEPAVSSSQQHSPDNGEDYHQSNTHRTSTSSRHKHGSHGPHHHHNLFPPPPYYATPLESDDFAYYEQQQRGSDDVYHVAYGRNAKNSLGSSSHHHNKSSSGTGSNAHHARKQHYNDDSDLPTALGYGASSASHHHHNRGWNGASTSTTSTGKRSSDALLSSSMAIPPFGTGSHSSEFNEDEWKEVVRKCKRVVVASNVVARVIGRGGQNINAIRDMSGAHIEIDKQKGAADRNITIRGSPEAIKFAYQLIMALVDEPDRDAMEIIQSYESLKPSSKLPAILQKSNLLSFAASHQVVLKGSGPPSTLPSRYSNTPAAASSSIANSSSTALTTTITCISTIPSLVSITYRTNKSQGLPTGSTAVSSTTLASTATVVSTTLRRSPSPSNDEIAAPLVATTTVYTSLSLTVTSNGAQELASTSSTLGTDSGAAAIYKDDPNANSFSGAWGFFTLPSQYSNNRDKSDRPDEEDAQQMPPQRYGNYTTDNNNNHHESRDDRQEAFVTVMSAENSLKTPIPHHTPAPSNDNLEQHPAPTAEYSPFNTFVNTMFPSSVWCKKEVSTAASAGHNGSANNPDNTSTNYGVRNGPSSALSSLLAGHDKGASGGSGNSSLAFKAANFASIVASPHPNAALPPANATSYPPTMSNPSNSPSLSHHHHHQLGPTSEPNTPPEEDLRKAPGYKRNLAVKALVMSSDTEPIAQSGSCMGDLLRPTESPSPRDDGGGGEFGNILGLSAPPTPLVRSKYRQHPPNNDRAPSSPLVVRDTNDAGNFKPISGFRDDCHLNAAPNNHSSVVGGGDSALSALNLINSFSQPSYLMLSSKVVSSKKHPAPIGNERVSHKNTSSSSGNNAGVNKYTPWSLGSDAPALNDWYNQSLLSLGRTTTSSSANPNSQTLTTTSSGGAGVYFDLNFNPETFFLQQNSQGFFNNATGNAFPSYTTDHPIGEFGSSQKAGSGKFNKDSNSAAGSDNDPNNMNCNNIGSNNLSSLHSNAFTNNNPNAVGGLPSFNASFGPLNLTASGGGASAFKDIKVNQTHSLPPLFAPPPPQTLNNSNAHDQQQQQHPHIPPTNFSMYSPHPFFNSLPPPFLAAPPPQGGSGPPPPPLGAPPHNLLNNLNSLFQQHQNQGQNNNANQGAVAAAAAFFLNNPAAAQLYPPSFKTNNPHHGLVNMGAGGGGLSDFNGGGICENGLGLDDTTSGGKKSSLGPVGKQSGGSNSVQCSRYVNPVSANNNVGNNAATLNQSNKPQSQPNLGAGLMNGFNFGGLDASNNAAANYANFFNQAFNGSNPPPGALNVNTLWNEQFKMAAAVAALASNAAAACNNNSGVGGGGNNDFNALPNLPPPFPPGVLPSFGNMPGGPATNSPFDPKLLNWNTWNSNV